MNNGLRYNVQEGISLLKTAGAWQQVRFPTQEDVWAAEKAYLGGRIYEITSAEAEDLAAAGYGAYIFGDSYLDIYTDKYVEGY